ncbi:MAG TPA: sulfurtransferase [Steroidobacteraceae bacterium]|nr:sulfurtransferase [Steroidobacteraceae bacterium]
MSYTTLVEPAQLAQHLGDPDWVIVDCRFDLAKPEAGRALHRAGHIPGARYAHLNEDLSAPITPRTGRHPLPSPEKFARRLGAWGIGAHTQVVAYDDAGGAIAARLWWMLQWVSHDAVAVLNGGLSAWLAGGFPLTSAEPRVTPATFVPRVRNEQAITVDPLVPALADRSIVLVDARSADRFAGQNEVIDPIPGHVPGARNHPFMSSLDSERRFLPAEVLRECWSRTLAGAPAEQVVTMCGSGVTACHALLALRLAGFDGARLYPGSWSEWIRDRSRPIATGSESD